MCVKRFCATCVASCRRPPPEDSDTVVWHRFSIRTNQAVGFAPDCVDLAGLSDKQVRNGQFAACCVAAGAPLPTKVACVIWDHTSQPGGVLQPARPRLFTRGPLRLEAGVAVKLQ